MKYKWTVAGTAADGQTWQTTGEIDVATGGDFHPALTNVMRLSFQQLTKGNAVFGQPGVGCRGPYMITRYVVEVASQ
jgi:hypothetical protein